MMLFPNRYMLLFTGIGDAYAVPVEYVDREKHPELFVEVQKFQRYCKHPKYNLGAGQYTDDTEMSVANALVLIGNEPPYTARMFADAWVDEFRRGGQRKGYSHKFQEFLEKTRTGEEFLANINSNSNKNGAAMRAAVLGVLHTIPDVLEVATLQASITHNTPEGLFSARAVALMSHFALYENASLRGDLQDYCLENLPREDEREFGYVFRTLWGNRPVISTPTESVAITTVHAVLSLVTRYAHFSLMRVLEEAIRLGGDTDSVAAIALSIAGSRMCTEDIQLPPFMYVDLENGDPRTGARYLLNVGTRLMAKFNQKEV